MQQQVVLKYVYHEQSLMRSIILYSYNSCKGNYFQRENRISNKERTYKISFVA
jgi:hypothetical protein